MANNNNLLFDYFDEQGLELVFDIRRVLLDNNKRATGQLVNSIQYQVIQQGENQIRLELSYADYLDYVMRGVNGTLRNNNSPFSFSGNKKMINTNSLVPWLNAKGIPQSAKFAIATSVYQKGIIGIKPDWENYKDQLINNILQGVGDIIADDVALQIEISFN